MAGIKALRKIQLGKESGGSPGTAVAATTIWRGMGLLDDQREIKVVGENVGYALPTTRNYTPKLAAAVIFDPIEATFQQLPYTLEAGIKKVGTGVADGAGDGLIYEYPFPGTSVNTFETYTIEGGNNQQAEEVEYCFVESFKISGNAAEGVMMSANWLGRQVSDATFTNGLSVPSLNPGDHIVFGGSKLFIDAIDGTLGSTEVSSTLLSFELDVTTGLRPKFTNEAKYFDYPYFDRGAFSATLKLVYEHNSSAETEKGHYQSNTPRLFQLQFLGDAFGTGGTAYDNYAFEIDCAGVYTEMPKGDVDGNDTIEATVQIGQDLTADEALTLRVVNESESLP